MSDIAITDSQEWTLKWTAVDTVTASIWLGEQPSLDAQQQLAHEADAKVADQFGSGFESMEYTLSDDGMGGYFRRSYRHMELRSAESLLLHFQDRWHATAFCAFEVTPTESDRVLLAQHSLQRVCDIFPGVHWRVDLAEVCEDPISESGFFIAKLAPIDIEAANREYPTTQ